MNRTPIRHVAPGPVVRNATTAPRFRLKPSAAAIRSAILAFSCTATPAFAQPPAVGTVPTGGSVVTGATIGDVTDIGGGNHSLTIQQNAAFAHIDWETFDIAEGSQVDFEQAATDFVLNNVTGGASRIYGQLSGDGTVAVINQAGILVGPSGVINVGGLIASSLAIAEDGLVVGNAANPDVAITLEIGTDPNSRVEIQGGASVTAGAAGTTIVGRTISNAGTIESTGPVQIYGADSATIRSDVDGNERQLPTVEDPGERAGGDETDVAITNSGTIASPGGSILLQAAAPGLLSVVNNTGVLSANAVAADSNGGTVQLVASGGGMNTGTVTATGTGTGTGGSISASASGGDLVVGALDTGATGSVGLGSNQQIVDDGNDGVPDVVTGSMSATSVAGIDLQISVGDITASVTGAGDLLIDQIGSGVTLTDVSTAEGSLAVTAQGDITATQVAATGGAATLESTVEGGNITATSVSGAGVTLIADAVDIGGTVDAGSGVATLRPTTDGTAISLGTEVVGELSLTDAELDNVTAGQVTVGSATSGNLVVNDSVSRTGTLNLVSGGTITTAADKNVAATTLTATATTGIDLDTDVATLDASVTGTGAIVIEEADGLTLRDVSASDGDVSVTSSSGDLVVGSISATDNTVNLTATGGSIADDGDGGGQTIITGSAVHLAVVDGGTVGANTGSGTVPAGYLDVAGTPTLTLSGLASSAHVQLVTSDTVTSTQVGGLVDAGRDLGIAVSDGDFSFDDRSFSDLGDGNLEVVANAIGLDHDAAGEQEIATAGNVLLRARTGAITDASDTNAALDVSAAALTLDAMTGIDLDTAVAELDASAAGGTLSIVEADAITLADVDNANGDIAVSAGGPITATAVEASAGDVTLTATGPGNGIATTFVSGTDVTLVAAGPVTGSGVAATNLEVTAAGIDLGTSVQNLDASASDGTLKITETDGITLADVDTANGGIEITAGGAITATDVAASGGDVTLTATGGSNGITTASVSGNTVTLTAPGAVSGGGIAATTLDVTGATIDLATSVENVSASAGGGTLTLTEVDAITLTDVDNADGDIEVTAAGTITATGVAAAGGDVTLTATGAGNGIATTSVSGTNVVLSAPGAITGSGVAATDLALSGGSIVLATSVERLTATASSGDLSITETSGITLADVTTSGGGNISVTANDGNIVVGTIDAGTGNVTLDADLAAGQRITDDAAGTLDDGTRIKGNAITLLAAGGIGAAGEDIDIDATSLTAQTTTGTVNVNEADSVTLVAFAKGGGAGDMILSTGSAQTVGTIDAGAGNVRITTRGAGADLTVGGTLTGGTVALASGGAILDGNAANVNVDATTLEATATGGIDLDTTVGSVTADAGAGAITLDQASGNLTLTSVSNDSGGIAVNVANGALTVASLSAGGGGSATLGASGAVTGSGVGADVTAQSLDVSSGSGGIDLDTAVDMLSAAATGVGGIDIDNTKALTLTHLTTADGNIRVDAAAGDLTVGTVAAGTAPAATSRNVTLTADGAGQSIRDDGNDGDVPTRVSGNQVTLSAGLDIGSIDEDLDTAATSITATATDVINIDQLGDVALQVTNPTGTVNATASGALSMTSPAGLTFGTVRGTGVSIESGGDIFIGAGGHIDGRDGTVSLVAAGDVGQDVGVDPAVSGDKITVVAGGTVGFPNVPLTVNAGSGAVLIDFTNDNTVAFVSGLFGSLNEGPRVLGLGSNTVLANNVGAIQSSFEERVSFKLDSSQFATETRIFSIEGTGVLPPEDQRE